MSYRKGKIKGNKASLHPYKMDKENKCENCEHYGRITKESGERCFIKRQITFPSGFKLFSGYVDAYPIPKKRTCKRFKKKNDKNKK